MNESHLTASWCISGHYDVNKLTVPSRVIEYPPQDAMTREQITTVDEHNNDVTIQIRVVTTTPEDVIQEGSIQ